MPVSYWSGTFQWTVDWGTSVDNYTITCNWTHLKGTGQPKDNSHHHCGVWNIHHQYQGHAQKVCWKWVAEPQRVSLGKLKLISKHHYSFNPAKQTLLLWIRLNSSTSAFKPMLSYQKSTAGWFQFQNLPESFPKHKHTRKKPGRHYHAIHTTLQLSTFSYNDVCLSQQRNCAAEQSCLVCQFQNLHPIPTNNLVVGRGWEQNSWDWSVCAI